MQREAIARWAEYRGVEIAAWHVDEDESGGTQDRPSLRAAIERIESGETEGIACWRLNRFARNGAGMTQEQLAERLGVDPTFVGRLERGQRGAHWRTIRRILAALDTSVSDLAAAIEAAERTHRS